MDELEKRATDFLQFNVDPQDYRSNNPAFPIVLDLLIEVRRLRRQVRDLFGDDDELEKIFVDGLRLTARLNAIMDVFLRAKTARGGEAYGRKTSSTIKTNGPEDRGRRY